MQRMVERLVAIAVIVAEWAMTASTPTAAHARGNAAPPPDVNTVLANLTNVIVGLLSALATLFLTIGGVMWLTAGGNPEQLTKAKNALKNAAIGYGIAVLAPVLLALLKKVVGQ
ncbi:pilin [Actinomadura sp. 6N118]|uniref:pilin n=1 Tax=Actinomadura sp. 6N118 TaxID=3375151 RepID=UPI0037B526C8